MTVIYNGVEVAPCSFCKSDLTEKEYLHGKTILFSMCCGKCYKQYLKECKEDLN